MFTGILGLLHLIIAIWAILSILKSGASTAEKIVWALVVLLFPVNLVDLYIEKAP